MIYDYIINRYICSHIAIAHWYTCLYVPANGDSQPGVPQQFFLGSIHGTVKKLFLFTEETIKKLIPFSTTYVLCKTGFSTMTIQLKLNQKIGWIYPQLGE